MTVTGRIATLVIRRVAPKWVRRPGLRWRLSAGALLVRTGLASLAGEALFVTVAASIVLRTAGLAALPATALALAAALGLPLWRRTSRLARSQFRVIGRIGALDTDRLTLRPVRGDDADALAAVFDPSMLAANGWTDEVKAAALQFVRRLGPVSGQLAITRHGDDELIGTVDVTNVDWTRRSCEMGWSVRPDCRGRGYVTEAARAALDALHDVGFDTVRIGMRVSNAAARRVADNVGATLVECGPHTLPDGDVADTAWYEHRTPLVATT
jgi:RimJ/RimL family protein N-acetyltransferase